MLAIGGFLVTNYEQVVRDLDVIAAWSPDLVVLDEAQRIKNWGDEDRPHIKQLKPEYRLVLTGTPGLRVSPGGARLGSGFGPPRPGP